VSRLQHVLAGVSHEQAAKLWELLSGHIEDEEASGEAIPAHLSDLRDAMDAAMSVVEVSR
jgi:hypothetical protein